MDREQPTDATEAQETPTRACAATNKRLCRFQQRLLSRAQARFAVCVGQLASTESRRKAPEGVGRSSADPVGAEREDRWPELYKRRCGTFRAEVACFRREIDYSCNSVCKPQRCVRGRPAAGARQSRNGNRANQITTICPPAAERSRPRGKRAACGSRPCSGCSFNCLLTILAQRGHVPLWHGFSLNSDHIG